MNFCLWITGLPGCGKSTIARALEGMLSRAGVRVVTLELDEIRTVLTPEPDYSEEERNVVYRSLVVMAKLLIEHSPKAVLIDATGNRRRFRELARKMIPEFAEVYVRCPLEVCRTREHSRAEGRVQQELYRKDEEGRLQGALPGVSAPYEEPENPEVVVPSDVLTPGESAREILAYLRRRWLRT